MTSSKRFLSSRRNGTLPSSIQGALIVEAEFVDLLPAGQAQDSPPPPSSFDPAELTNNERPVSLEDLMQAVTGGKRRTVFTGLAEYSGYPTGFIEGLFQQRRETALLVVCEDAGLNYPQTCQILHHIAKIRSFPPRNPAAMQKVRDYLRVAAAEYTETSC
jgi:hypothetical protein